MGFVPLQKRPEPENCLTSSTLGGHRQKMAVYEPGRGPSLESASPHPGLPSLWNMRNKLQLVMSYFLWYSVKAARTD
jgi:hypothetical protein